MPESALANRPTLIALIILAQIVVTLVFVGFFSRRQKPAYMRDGLRDRCGGGSP
ncbi:MAG TPA: hypothetical protein VK845_10120 [Gemmatimonadales bacterium]|nr:hypothetical protein [Gemmatimonadales bacterium]